MEQKNYKNSKTLWITVVSLTLFFWQLNTYSEESSNLWSCAKELANRAIYLTQAHKIARLDTLDKTRPTLIVVDGLSSGAEYPVIARKLIPNIQVVHLQSTRRLAPGLKSSFQESDYELNLIAPTSSYYQKILTRKLSRFRTLKIVAGTETSAMEWARYTEALNLPGMPLHKSHLATEKYAAAKALSQEDIKTIPGELFDTPEEALAWVDQQGFDFPLILKPLSAAGGFGVKKVIDKEAFIAHFNKIRSGYNPLGKRMNNVLVQPMINHNKFTEFSIDVVVDPNQGVVVSGSLRYKKEINKKGDINYLTSRIVDFSQHPHLLTAFSQLAKTIATTYKLKCGVLHIEAFVSNETLNSDDPKLTFVEAGTRPVGAKVTQLYRGAGSTDVITAHLLSLFNPDEFRNLSEQMPQFSQHGTLVGLLGPEVPGRVREIPSDSDLRTDLPGFLASNLHLEVGKRIGATEDLFESAGILMFTGNKETIDNAEAMVRAYEQDSSGEGMYRLR